MRKKLRASLILRTASVVAALLSLGAIFIEGEWADPDIGVVLQIPATLLLLIWFFMPDPSGHRTIFDLIKHGLTPREAQFTRLVLAGKTMKEIAIDCGVTSSTVRNAMSSVYGKLGISGERELVEIGATYTVV
jgi:DNA-binding CsgD family transcriptional regulator